MAGMSFWQRIKMVPALGPHDGGMRVTLWSGALVVAIGWVIAAFTWERSWSFALAVASGMVLSLYLIWLGTRASELRPLAALGWLFLLGLPLLLLVIVRINP
jgi:hypothetical protein